MGDVDLMIIFAAILSLVCLVASLWLNNEGSTA
jgi:hypothetical protein